MHDKFGLSLAQWSLHRAFLGPGRERLMNAGLDNLRFADWLQHNAASIRRGRLDPLEFPAEARRLGFDTVEYVNTFYFDRPDQTGYFTELRRRADGEGVSGRLIMCDFEGLLGAADSTLRDTAIARHARWLEPAAALGCSAIRVNALGDGPPPEQQRRIAESLDRLAERAAPYGLDVLVENHGALAADAEWMAGLFEAVGHTRIGALIDFGNWRGDVYAAVARLMPYARGVSAKSYDFGADGRETTLDYQRLFRIIDDSGYRGLIGIEYEGSRLEESEGIEATRALVRRILEGL